MDDVEEKIRAVYAEIERKAQEAEQLSLYLQQQQTKAHLDEEKEEEELKRQGIIVGQHIPSLPSRLNLDPTQIAEYENFASTVLVAKELMVQNRTNFLRRTGNLPISELAETRKEANLKYMAEMTSEVPHYLLETHAAEVRKERNTVRFEETIQATKRRKTKKFSLESSHEAESADLRGKERKLPASAKERMEHEKVLQSLNHKLNYLRNPRNDPAAVTKMLVKPKSYYVNKQLEEASASEGSDTASLKKRYAKQTAMTDNPLFLCEPSAVLFMDFDIGQKYTRSLAFRNTSAVTRSVRVLPPKSPLFTISPLKYPSNSVGGMVAPGMSVSTVLTFVPRELGDFEDCVTVQSESGTSKVRVLAQREPPKLSIPPVIGLPDCLVGDAQRSSLVCSNNGGMGRFVLFSEDVDHPEVESQHPSLRIRPFTIYPTTFTLSKGESVELIIEYVPLTLGLQQRKFFVHCDNGQVREFTLQAKSKQLQVTVGEVNQVLFDFHDKSVFHDLVFRSVTVGADKSQQVVVLNDTGLSVEYEWVWVDTDLDRQALSKAGQDLIRRRQQRAFDHEDTGEQHTDFLPGDSLLRSIKNSLDDDAHETLHAADRENRTHCGALEISPARGVIAGEGAAQFQFSYCPRSYETQALRAVLMVKSIPQAALPDEDQHRHLRTLAERGHGKFMRLLSWIEDLATAAEVPEYTKRNGSISTSAPLLQLSTVVQLLRSQMTLAGDSDGEWEQEVTRFHQVVHRVLRHAYDVRRSVGLGDDSTVLTDDEASVADEGKPEPVYIELFDWSGDADSNPKPLLPYAVPADMNEADLDDDNDGPPSPSDRRGLSAEMQYSAAEQDMMTGIWVDSANVCKLVGEGICSLLDDRVMHEAVDFLKDGALNHLAALSLCVFADSEQPRVSVHPPYLEMERPAPLGHSCSAEISFINHSSAPVQLQILTSQFSARRLYASHADDLGDDKLTDLLDSDDIVRSFFRVHSDFEYLLVMPSSRELFRFEVACNALGRFELTLPVVPAQHNAAVEQIVLRLNVSGPTLRFEAAEIDLGLLGVGQEESRSLTFTNLGSVAAMFMMKPQLFVETTVPKKGLGAQSKDAAPTGVTVITSRPNTHRDQQPTSARSTSSRGSARSGDFSVADSNATSTDFKIEMKNALVVVEPSSGVIAPGQSLTVKVVGKAGKLPQRIRGMIETRVFEENGLVEVHRQFLNLRGEVQSPKVVLYPMHQSLGQVYVGRPVHFKFTLENICNLSTKFKFLRPGGQSSMFSFSLSPTKGSLEAKQKLEVEGSFVALAPGLIDDVLACKMFGISLPLGFSVKALAKGIQLDFANLGPDDAVPAPLAEPHAVQFPDGDKPPEPGAILPIVLGDSVPLYERRSARFVIRNLSAIPAPFEIRPRKFAVSDGHSKRKSGLSEPSTASSVFTAQGPRSDLILAPHEDGKNKFESEAGKKYIGATVERREDKTFLKSGLGAAYAFSVAAGVVPPWGVQEVVLSAFNDIPGSYDDDIEVAVKENDIVRKFVLPVQLSVVGCPVVIEKSTVGMTVVQPKGPVDLRGKQLLQLGQGCEHGAPLVREFFLKNHGSKSAAIKWTVRGLASKMNGPVKVSVALGQDGRAKCSLRFWDDLAKESPFTINPAACDVTPYGRAKFQVTFARSSPAALERAQLTAKVSVRGEDDEAGALADADGSVSVGGESVSILSRAPSTTGMGGSSKKQPHSFSLQLVVEGQFLHPQLTIDRRTFVVHSRLTEVANAEALAMRAKATILFSSDGKLGQPCTKFITVANPLEIPLLLTLSTEGALLLKDAQDKEVPAPAPQSSAVSGGSSVVSKSSMSSSGKTLSLGPFQSSKLVLTFQPRKQVREQLLSTFGMEAGKPTEQTSYVIATFPTGQTLRLPVITSISTPFISGSSPRVNFGTCHTRLTCQALYLLRNPTDVPARWTVSHVKGGGLWRQSTAIRVKGFDQGGVDVDDPSVFNISPDSGLIEGPTVTVTAAMAAPPKDFNRLEDSVVAERLMQSSWALQTLTLNDSLDMRHRHQAAGATMVASSVTSGASETCYPLPLTILFSPKKNVSYCSRFRFHCEFANSFDVVLQGVGTFEEQEHKPLNPVPR